jgi:hypothetical protein
MFLLKFNGLVVNCAAISEARQTATPEPEQEGQLISS